MSNYFFFKLFLQKKYTRVRYWKFSDQTYYFNRIIQIEIELRHEDGESYTGTVTMQEAKYGIYRDGLGFQDFKNFDGVRYSFKGVRTVQVERAGQC